MMREGTGKYALCLRFETALVAPYCDERSDQQNGGNEQDHQAGSAEKVTCLPAEDKAGNAKDGRPGHATGEIEGKEPPPIHLVDAGEQRGEGTQHGDETSEKDDLAAVLEKQIHAELHLGLVEVDISAVAQHQLVAELAAEPEADVVAEDGTGRRRGDDQGDVEVVRRSGIDGGGEQHRLARKWDADALDADKEHDRPITIGGYQLVEFMTGEMHEAQSQAASASTDAVIAIRTARVCVARSIEAVSERWSS